MPTIKLTHEQAKRVAFYGHRYGSMEIDSFRGTITIRTEGLRPLTVKRDGSETYGDRPELPPKYPHVLERS